MKGIIGIYLFRKNKTTSLDRLPHFFPSSPRDENGRLGGSTGDSLGGELEFTSPCVSQTPQGCATSKL